jgi:glycosyltransferase involved in cell wall biosynthesis
VLGVVEELVKEIPDTLMLIFTPRSISNMKLAKEIHQKAIRLNLADKVKIHIKNLSEREKAEVYSVADIFLYPESGPKAAIDPPLTIIEAMASGRVVFAPRSSSASEFIADKKSGFLFRQKDYNDLARRFAEILMNKDLKKRVSHQARCVVEQKSSMLVVGAKMLGHFTALINH